MGFDVELNLGWSNAQSRFRLVDSEKE